ncbi:alpha/beta fold hydrolase [Bdellovibrio bacteriovorus]|nr:alpha/beta fold hydrolase [Bdellovibrio bacteriovorus]
MKKIALFISVLLVSLTAAAKVQHLRLGTGKVIAYEHIQTNKASSTLILLPGVNRSLSADDRSVQLLAEQGWNLLLPSLPAHPLSIEGLSAGETPYFLYDSSLRAVDFASDIEKLVAALKIKQAIPVTLSYTSTVGAYLNPKLFPHVIETVPLGIPTETNPEAARNAQLWENWLRMNPVMAPFWIRQSRDQAYSKHWGAVVDANLARDPDYYGANPRIADIKSGYVTIARAAEDFDLTKVDYKANAVTRDFVLAGQENSERLKNQIVALKNYLRSGKPARVMVVANAGHVLPSESPSVYAAAIGVLAQQPVSAGVSFMVVRKAADVHKAQWQGASELEAWMDGIVK